MQYLDLVNNEVNAFVKWSLQDVVHILGLIIIMDIVLGFTKAWVTKTFSSYKARTGIVSHMFALLLSLFAHSFGVWNNMEFFDTVIWLLVIAYLGSMLENLAVLGVPIPNVVTDKLAQVRDFLDDSAKSDVKDEAKKIIDNKADEDDSTNKEV